MRPLINNKESQSVTIAQNMYLEKLREEDPEKYRELRKKGELGAYAKMQYQNYKDMLETFPKNEDGTTNPNFEAMARELAAS
ncbi:MAG: hypothetical protein H7839_16940 [Magnetococcus sp. YQC-5]